jgi:hypothetical protein
VGFWTFEAKLLRTVRLTAPLIILLLIGQFPLKVTPAQDVRFTDITEKAGITFKHVFSPDKKYIAESMSGGVALFDYDNDGYLDIYLVNSLTVDLAKAHKKTKSALYHNNGDGTFTVILDLVWVSPSVITITTDSMIYT